MSDKNSACSSDIPAGILIGPTSAKGTRAYSACPPAYPPNICEYPKIPEGEWPHSFSAIHAFGFEFSHNENIFLLQEKHPPHAIGNGTTTRSPFRRLRTRGPTSTTSPINSWPRMSPLSIVGTKPL